MYREMLPIAQLMFNHLKINDLFSFRYEIDWYNKTVKAGKFSQNIACVPIFRKTSKDSYEVCNILADARKKPGYIYNRTNGRTIEDAPVCRILPSPKGWRVLEQ
jgi:hypothetical protein